MEEEEGGPRAAEAPRLANVIWWGTGVMDRSVNAAIWFGLEQISAAFWGQNNPALPICGGKRTARSGAKYLKSWEKKKKSMNKSGKRSNEEREENNTVVGGWNKEANRLVSSRLSSKWRARQRCRDA